MSYLRTLRTAAVTAVIAGTVLLPATGAFAAEASAKPTPTPTSAPATDAPRPGRGWGWWSGRAG
ncbi:hypothetical protein O3X23_04970, partial [Streptomyces sp. H39-S7]|nr:hypothetical protein [Streptomyces sp. H39-S7]